MRRQTVYPGQIPLETDILSTNKNVMIAIGHLLQDMIGTSTLFSGLGCVPTSPAGMTVNVNPGRAYSYQATDSGAYSSLAADAHQIVKQGILLDAVNFACAAPTTAGFSINYLIEGAFQEVDAGSVVLPYYNAANPAQAYSGPNGTGTSNTTYRDNTVQLQLKTGIAATTGSQVTPTPDAGFNGLWVVSVPYGTTSITSGMISQYSGAPFLSASLLAQIQAPIPGRLLRTSVYTNVGGTQMVSVNGGTTTATGATTFTPLAATTFYDAEVQGGGGSGGGTGAQTSSTSAISGGGSAGSYARALLTTLSTQTITVGVGGAASVVGGNGNAGGTSSVGSLVSAPGGSGSAVGAATGGAGVQGGTGQATAPTGGNILSLRGGAGVPSIQSALNVGIAGSGGASVFGVGAPGPATPNTNGTAASNPGTGSSGAYSGSSNATGNSSAAAASGIVITREYA